MHGSKSATLLIATLMMIGGIAHAYQTAEPSVGIDYYQFWAVGRAINQTSTVDIYSQQARRNLGSRYLGEALRSQNPKQLAVAEHRRVFETTATPFLYTVFGAVSATYDQSLSHFRAMLLGAFVLSVLGLARLSRNSTATAFLVIGLLAQWFEPLASDLRVGNVGSFQLLQVVIYAYLRLHLPKHARHGVSGIWLGLSLAFKPNLAPLVVLVLLWPLLIRDWSAWLKSIGGVMVGVFGAIVASTLAIGSAHSWVEWVRALNAIPSAQITTAMGNFSPLEVLRPYCGAMTGVVVGVLGLGCMIAGLTYRLRARHGWGSECPQAVERHELMWILAIGCLTPILAVRLAWLHYFVLTTPALLLSLTRLQFPLMSLVRRGRGALTQPVQSEPNAQRSPAGQRTGTRAYAAAILRSVRVSLGAASQVDRLCSTLIVLAVVGAWLGLATNPLALVGRSYTMQAYGVMIILAAGILFGASCAPSCRRDSVAAAPADET